MSDTLMFLIAFVVSVRTFSYGIWTFSNKNVLGGIFIFFVALSIVFLASYILFFNRT